jgi:hypothetical protein
VAREHLLARRDDGAGQAPADVGLERQDALSLTAIAIQHDRQRFLDLAERLIDDLRPDAAIERLGAYGSQPLGKRGPRVVLSPRRQTNDHARPHDRYNHDGEAASGHESQCTGKTGEQVSVRRHRSSA